MITFVDEKGTEHSALVAYSVTNAVNGELSVKGTIYTNDKVLHGIGRGWRFRLDDEYFRITYAKPNDTGRQIEVEFDAVHQFFYDMSKSMVYTTLNGSKPFETYLQAIFSGSGYTYNLETTVGSIRKENFGNKSRLSLFNDIIKAAGLEFSVRGHVIRILKRIGTDLSTIVRKDFNMNELKIEKNINSFVTYQRGLGAWKDDEDHSKGRYETSYESPLSAIYGRIEADPIVDERYKDTGKLLERLKENVDKSYKVSVEIDMEDLSQAGYRISRPNPGDYIMAINETLGFRQKVRIVSFTSEYDVGGNLISRKVVCNDIGTVQRVTSEISHLSRTLTDSIEGSERALKTATKALVSADGKNTNYFGDVKPLDVPKGTLRKGDRLFLTVGDKKQLYFWNGAEWELEPTEFDHEKFDMEFNRNSQEIKKTIQENRQKAEEALRNAGASTLLAQEAKRIGLDSIAKLEAFKSQATSAQTALSGDLDVLKRTIANDIRPKQEQVTAEIAKQVEALIQTKKELAGVKSAQATYEETTTRRLSELTNLANGKASKSELTQTAEQLASKIASVRVGGVNLFKGSKDFSGSWVNLGNWTRESEKYQGMTVMSRVGTWFGISQAFATQKGEVYTLSFYIKSSTDRDRINVYFTHASTNQLARTSPYMSSVAISNEWQRTSVTFEITESGFILPRIERFNTEAPVYVAGLKLERGNISTDYSEAPEDIEGQISIVESSFRQRADALDAGVSRLTEGLRTKADISSLNVTAENIRQSVKSLETDTQNKLNQMLSLAEFEVRASSIRQEILNVKNDKADKTLVTAEAGKLREEFSNLRVGGTNLLKGSKGPFLPDRKPANFDNNVLYAGQTSVHMEQGQEYIISAKTDGNFTAHHDGLKESDNVVLWIMDKNVRNYQIVSDLKTGTTGTKIIWNKPTGIYHLRVNTYHREAIKSVWDVKIEKGTLATDWSPAPEDTEGLITEAKATFERTAQGLRTDLSAIQEYVNKDSQRQEALQRYTREESARQATALREQVSRDYVGKSAYQEDVRGLERRFEAITNPQNGSIATQIANYKTAVDGRLTEITSMISGKANQTDFQRVKETSQLYERILGNTDNGIADNVARMALTNQLFQVEVTKASASGRNLFLNSLFKRDLRKRYSTYDLFDGKDQTQGQLALSIDTNEKFKGANTLKIVSTFNGKHSNQKATFTIGGDARLGTVDEMRNKSVRFSFWAKSTVNNTNFQARAGYRSAVKGISLTTDWQFYDIEFIRNENSNATSELILHIFTAATVWIAFPKIEIGTVATPFSEAPEDTDEAIRTVQSQLAGSWGVHNKNSVNEIIAGFNLAGRNAGIKAETIRLEGNTLADKLTAIDGYFKRLFVGDASVGTLNSDIIRSNSITADKLVMDMAMARRFVSSDIFTDTLAAKEAFINKLRSVVVTATFLEGFQGKIGGFRLGQYKNRNGYFITGTDSVSVGMGNGTNAGANRNAFWANWGESLDTPGPKAWYVNTDGKMYCRNEATFHSKVDFSSISNPNFYSKIKAHKGVWVGTDDVNGEGDNPAGGYNAVVWWSQIVTGKFRQHAGITTGSDRKLKENIEPTPVKALDKINALNLVAFDYIKDKTHEEIGLIAQEVLNIIPSSVEKYEDEDNHLTINYSKFVPYLIKAIQELNQKIEKMEKTIA